MYNYPFSLFIQILKYLEDPTVMVRKPGVDVYKMYFVEYHVINRELS